MRDEKLFEITHVVDDSTGIWAGDLCEYGIVSGRVHQFLMDHGEEGLKEIEAMTATVLKQLREHYLPEALAAKAQK